MKRVRVLLYDYRGMTRKQIAALQGCEGVKGTVDRGNFAITSIELNPLKITILELLRLFKREAK